MARKHSKAGKKRTLKQRQRKYKGGGWGFTGPSSIPGTPGTVSNPQVFTGIGDCRAVQPGYNIPYSQYGASFKGLPGMSGGKRTRKGSKGKTRKQRGGRYGFFPEGVSGVAPNGAAWWAGSYPPVQRIGCEGGSFNPLNPTHTGSSAPPGAANPNYYLKGGAQQMAPATYGVGNVDSMYYYAPTGGYANTASTWKDSVGAPVQIQVPYAARAMNQACLTTGGHPPLTGALQTGGKRSRKVRRGGVRTFSTPFGQFSFPESLGEARNAGSQFVSGLGLGGLFGLGGPAAEAPVNTTTTVAPQPPAPTPSALNGSVNANANRNNNNTNNRRNQNGRNANNNNRNNNAYPNIPTTPGSNNNNGTATPPPTPEPSPVPAPAIPPVPAPAPAPEPTPSLTGEEGSMSSSMSSSPNELNMGTMGGPTGTTDPFASLEGMNASGNGNGNGNTSASFGGRSRKSRRSRRSALKKKKFKGGSLNYRTAKNKLVAKSKNLLSKSKKNLSKLKSKVGSRIGSLTWKSTQKNILTAPQRLAGKVGIKVGNIGKKLLNKGKAAYSKFQKARTLKKAKGPIRNVSNLRGQQNAMTRSLYNNQGLQNLAMAYNAGERNAMLQSIPARQLTPTELKLAQNRHKRNMEAQKQKNRNEQARSGFRNESIIKEAERLLPQRLAEWQKAKNGPKLNPFDPDPKKPNLLNIVEELEGKNRENNKKRPVSREAWLLQKQQELKNAERSVEAGLTRAQRAERMRKLPSFGEVMRTTGNVAGNIPNSTAKIVEPEVNLLSFYEPTGKPTKTTYAPVSQTTYAPISKTTTVNDPYSYLNFDEDPYALTPPPAPEYN